MKTKAGPSTKQNPLYGPPYLGIREVPNKIKSVRKKNLNFSNIKTVPVMINVSPWRVFLAEINI